MNPSTVCDCADTSMSLEEQLKQPWAKGVNPPVEVGDPLRYPESIKEIRFENGYVVRWSSDYSWGGPGWGVIYYHDVIGRFMTLRDAISQVSRHSISTTKDKLKAARTAWEAEEKRKKAPETINVSLTYKKNHNGSYRLCDTTSCAVAGHTSLTSLPKVLGEMPYLLSRDLIL